MRVTRPPSRLRISLAGLAVALLIPILALGVGAIDTTSTSGVRIVHVPEGESASGVAMVGDAIAINRPSLQPLSGLWPGEGSVVSIKDDLPFGAFNIEIEDMNANLELVGSYRLDGAQHAFVWSESLGAVTLPHPPNFVLGSTFAATGISDDGWIVGRYRASAGTCYTAENTCGFLAVPNDGGYEVDYFQQPSPFATFGVEDIELATIDGVAQHVAVGVGLVWTDANGGQFFFLDSGSTDIANAHDVNRRGEIVGFTSSGGALEPAYWASLTAPITRLGVLTAGDNFSVAHAINDAGTVVGQSGTAFNEGTAFVWDADQGLRDLGHIAPGTTFSAARGLNEDGVIVGESAGDAVLWDLNGDYGGNGSDPVSILVEESVVVLDDPNLMREVVIQVSESVIVSEAAAVIPPVFIAVSEAVSVGDSVSVVAVAGPVSITVFESVAVSDDVVVTPGELGSVSGLKWEDLDGDGVRDDGEPVLQGVVVYLDVDADGVLGLGEPWTVTDSDGIYTFSGLAAGDLVVREVVPAGYVQTFPHDPDDAHRVALTAGQTVNGLDFGNRPDRPPVIAPIPDVFGVVGDLVEIPLNVTDPEGDQFTKTVLVDGVDLTSVINGVIPFVPGEEHVGRVLSGIVVATQNGDPTLTTSETFRIFVGGVPEEPDGAPQVSPAIVPPGGEIEVTGSGFASDSSAGAFLFSQPVVLGSAEVGEDGTFTATFALSTDLEVGLHNVVVMGIDGSGELRVLVTEIDVIAEEVDASSLVSYLDELPNHAFKGVGHRTVMKATIRAAALAVSLGQGERALDILNSLDRRIDGCGARPDGNDWIVDCEIQSEFRELLAVYKRSIQTLPRSDPFPWW